MKYLFMDDAPTNYHASNEHEKQNQSKAPSCTRKKVHRHPQLIHQYMKNRPCVCMEESLFHIETPRSQIECWLEMREQSLIGMLNGREGK